MAESLIIFNQFLEETRTELVDQQVQLFNAASNGAISLSVQGNKGDFSQASHYALIPGLVRRRDQGGTGAVTPVNIASLLEHSVKVAAGTPPVEYQPNQWSWMMRNPAEAGVMLGQQLGLAQVQDMLNVAISAAVAAITQNADLTFDGSAGDTTLSALNSGARQFGDRSQAIAAWVMHSQTFHDLTANGLLNAERLFTFENVSIMQDATGRPFIITDSDAFIEVDQIGAGDDRYSILGLTNSGIVVEDNSDFNSETLPVLGNENIGQVYQAGWTYNLGMKGYTWDIAAGRSPTNAALATSANWDQTATSDKDTAGVAVQVGLTNPVGP